MWKNNPVSLIDSEIEAIARLTEDPIIVSVGTGSAKVKGPEGPGSRGIWRDGFIPRLYRALMAQMRGKRFWQEFQNRRRIDSRENHFRFDIDFDKIEPNLDQVSQIPQMAEKAQEQFLTSKDIDILAHHFIAAHFHFELETVPERVRNQYSGAGYILCDLKRSHPAYEALLSRLSKGSARFYLNNRLISGRIEDRSFIGRNGGFCKRVEFQTMETKLSIGLKLQGFQPQNISGSPFSIDKRVEAQNLDAYFGQANHRKRKRPNQDERSAKRQRR
jgi:hypothetical protein